MANIIILGAGVMGSALSVPPASIAGNSVTLVGSPLDDALINSIRANRHHPTLNAPIDESVNAVRLTDFDTHSLHDADVVVIGVSSAGMNWVCQYLSDRQAKPATLALVTKGLVQSENTSAPPLTYADSLAKEIDISPENIVGIGGPCIARELALGYPTRVTFAATDTARADAMRQHFQTQSYRISISNSIVAVEACAALKNFLCIGVSAMLSAYPLDSGSAKNPLAALYNQAVRELFMLSQWISDASITHNSNIDHPMNHVAFDLAGMGDLHVTVGGGRNSRLGAYLGQGKTLTQIQKTTMQGVTVEGVDTGRNLLRAFEAACRNGSLDKSALPLTDAILRCIELDSLFAFDFATLPG